MHHNNSNAEVEILCNFILGIWGYENILSDIRIIRVCIGEIYGSGKYLTIDNWKFSIWLCIGIGT